MILKTPTEIEEGTRKRLLNNLLDYEDNNYQPILDSTAALAGSIAGDTVEELMSTYHVLRQQETNPPGSSLKCVRLSDIVCTRQEA